MMNMRSGRREPNVFPTLFPSVNLGSRDLRSMREKRQRTRDDLDAHGSRLRRLARNLKTLLKHGGSTRDGVLKWIFVNLRVNKKRSQEGNNCLGLRIVQMATL